MRAGQHFEPHYGGIKMRIIKVIAAVMTVSLLAFAVTSCKEEKSRRERHSGRSEDLQANDTKPVFDVEKYYVMIGTTEENYGYIRLRYFDGDEIYPVIWFHPSNDYDYGDVFVAPEGIEPVRAPVDDYPPNEMPPYELGSGIGLEKIGNCNDLMESKNLTVTSVDYDGMQHWSVRFKDKDENEYHYGFFNNAYFGVELTSATKGDKVTCAFNGGEIVIPLK